MPRMLQSVGSSRQGSGDVHIHGDPLRDRLEILMDMICASIKGTRHFKQADIPSIFVIYAHDPADDPGRAKSRLVRSIIDYFKKIGAPIRSDRSSSLAGDQHASAARDDILANQFCLLPRQFAPDPVDKVLLFQSELLKEYCSDPKGADYVQELQASGSRAITEQQNRAGGANGGHQQARDIQESVRRVVHRHVDEQHFHHVLTEIGLVAMRAQVDRKIWTIIPINLGDRTTDPPQRTFPFLSPTQHYLSLAPEGSIRFDPLELTHRLFFDLLGRIYGDLPGPVTMLVDLYEVGVKKLPRTTRLDLGAFKAEVALEIHEEVTRFNRHASLLTLGPATPQEATRVGQKVPRSLSPDSEAVGRVSKRSRQLTAGEDEPLRGGAGGSHLEPHVTSPPTTIPAGLLSTPTAVQMKLLSLLSYNPQTKCNWRRDKEAHPSILIQPALSESWDIKEINYFFDPLDSIKPFAPLDHNDTFYPSSALNTPPSVNERSTLNEFVALDGPLSYNGLPTLMELPTLSEPPHLGGSSNLSEPSNSNFDWLFSNPSFLSWLSEDTWMLGITSKDGVGTSKVLAAMHAGAEGTEESTHIHLCFAFQNVENTRSRSDMYEGLLAQLLLKQPSAGHEYWKWAFQPGKEPRPFPTEVLRQLFIQCLSRACQSARYRIFLDALDEMDDTERREIMADLRMITREVEQVVSHGLTICYTSLPNLDVLVDNGLEINLETQKDKSTLEDFASMLRDVSSEPTTDSYAIEISIAATGGNIDEIIALIMLLTFSQRHMVLGELRLASSWDDGPSIDTTSGKQATRRPVDTDGSMCVLIDKHTRSLAAILDLEETVERPHSSKATVSWADEAVARFFQDEFPGHPLVLRTFGLEETAEQKEHSTWSWDASRKSLEAQFRPLVVGSWSWDVGSWSWEAVWPTEPAEKKQKRVRSWKARGHDRLGRACWNFVKLKHAEWEDLSRDELLAATFCDYAVEYLFVHAAEADRHGISQQHLSDELGAAAGSRGENLRVQWARAYGRERRAAKSLSAAPTLDDIARAFDIRGLIPQPPPKPVGTRSGRIRPPR